METCADHLATNMLFKSEPSKGEEAIDTVMQDVVVILVFILGSVFAYRLRSKGQAAKDPCKGPAHVSNKLQQVAPPQANVPGGFRAQRFVMCAKQEQILNHLANHDFTRALNLFRTYERDGRDQYFSVELFIAFVQAAIRMEKLDVIERMLHSMRRAGVVGPTNFWQSTFRILSSRKLFSMCTFIHEHFEDMLPEDRVVVSCLVNAALEVGHARRAAAILQKYKKVMDLKDYVLFFRTYAALDDVNAAKGVFQELSYRTTPIMLNLLLLTCVKVRDSSRALETLRQAMALQVEHNSRIVDEVSFNTTMKGFIQEGRASECVDCFLEMLSHGFEPSEVTFGHLFDACEMDKDLGGAYMLGKIMLESNSQARLSNAHRSMKWCTLKSENRHAHRQQCNNFAVSVAA